jgi:hypothetical protein
LWLFHNVTESLLLTCALTACCRLLLASCAFAFFRAQGHGRRTGTESHSRQRLETIPSYSHNSEGGAVFCCEKLRAPEAEPRAPRKSKQRRAARLCMDLYTHSTTTLSRSLPFGATPPPAAPRPPPPPNFPLNAVMRCLPCLLLSSSRLFPCKRTINKESSAFKSGRPVLFVALFLFAKMKARRSKLPCLIEAMDLMHRGWSLCH